MAISFHSAEKTHFNLNQKRIYSSWIKDIFIQEGKSFKEISFVFCDDNFLLEINRNYLKHNYLTDIITFQYAEEPIEGELYISIDRVKENAIDFKDSFDRELKRVMAHGILHLCGFKDKTDTERSTMRAKESHYIDRFQM